MRGFSLGFILGFCGGMVATLWLQRELAAIAAKLGRGCGGCVDGER